MSTVANESDITIPNGEHKNSIESCLDDKISSPNTSRYGRSMRFKSNANNPPKNSVMPKISPEDSLSCYSDDTSTSGFLNSSQTTDDMSQVSFEETELLTKCKWLAGELAWGRVGNFPFWPCVVTLDPVSLLHYKTRSAGKSKTLMIHVQYFGDKGRHGWVSVNGMIPFTGLDDFYKLRDSINLDSKKKISKHLSAFHAKPGRTQLKWDLALKEAQDLLSMSTDDRAKAFQPKIKSKSKPKVDVEAKKKSKPVKTKSPKIRIQGKRKLSNHFNEPDPKRSKLTNQMNGSKIKPVLNGKHNQEKTRKPVTSKSQKHQENLKNYQHFFDIFYERHRDLSEQEYPDATEDEIKQYLEKTWQSMGESFREKYQSTFEVKLQSPERDVDLSSIARFFKMNDKKSKKRDHQASDQDDDSTSNVDSKKSMKIKTEKEEVVNIEPKKIRPYNIFKGVKQERVCQICEKTGKLTRCRGPCYSYFHLSCVKPGESSPEHSINDNSIDDKIFERLKKTSTDDEDNVEGGKTEEQEDETFKCIDCLSGVAPACFICNGREGERIRCSALTCGRHYHSTCLKPWPQSHWQGGRLNCPYHICHTCSSDDPQGSRSRGSNEKLARCTRCPSSYHTSVSCLPAGSEILTGSQIICPKHCQSPHPPVNATWCFLCTRGGSLICCDTCPCSFHLECLGIDAPDGAFICEDCETGRLPLYGEVVWVKLGNYRWWPSLICYPHQIPENIDNIPHGSGNFCVMFLGSNNYYWIHRGRAFLYQDGDANIKPSFGKNTIRDDNFRKALEEANIIYQNIKTQRAAAKTNDSRALKPPPYVKIKINKPIGNVKPAEVDSMVACDCEEQDDNPCAPGSDCLNRILLVECSPGICPAGAKCNNQAFVRRQYPEMEPFHTIGRGWGLKTLESIDASQFVIEYVGEVIDEAEYKRRLHRKKELKNENFYFLTIDNNRMIDAEPKGNPSRFMNHSCSPNCETQKWTVNGDTRIGLFALRDIESGEELTFNYNLACDGETRKPCLCGASNCSGFIGLKVQKPVSSSAVQEKKVDKMVKRRRKKKRIICWSCGESIINDTEYIVCSQKTCNKSYHKTCTSIDDSVDSRFRCAWHNCAKCGRRTSAHCSFCSAAYCQGHVDGNLFEHGEKTGAYVCKTHENISGNGKSSGEDEKESSDNDVERNELNSSPASSNLSSFVEKKSRESSPRVSIIEVQPPSCEGTQDRDQEEIKPDNLCLLSIELQENHFVDLNKLTSSQLEAIIGINVDDHRN